jgi:putative membrane protein
VNLQRKVLLGLAAACAVTWLITAVNPLDRQAWILENVLLIVLVVVLFFGHRRLQLSITSYSLLAAFIILHIIGAHYTYARMPLGLWVKDYFGLSRNHYDRFAHGAFGFLLAFPVWEVLLRFSGINRRWSFWVAPAIIVAVSGVFEIIESTVAEIVAPGKGMAWLGGQGDEWDAQNDMLAATIGAGMMMALVALTGRKTRNDEDESHNAR